MNARKPPKAGKCAINDQLTVVSNGMRREILQAEDLPSKMRNRVDLLPDGYSVIVYQGDPIPLENFNRLMPGDPLYDAGWHGVAFFGFSAGYVIWLDDDTDTCIVGRYYC